MNWIALVVLNSFVMAGNSILDKWLMDGQRAQPLACAASFGLVGFPVAVVGLIVLPPIHGMLALRALVAGGLLVGAVWLYYDTVSKEEISRLVPLIRLTSLQTLLLAAIFLGESLSLQQLVAFGIILSSSILLSLKTRPGGITLSRAALRIVPVTTLLSLNSILLAPVYRTASLWHGVVWENAGIVLGVTVLGAGAVLRQRPFWRIAERRTWVILTFQQVNRLIGGLIPAWAIANGVPLALLSALDGMRPASVWLLAIVLLHERIKRQELVFKGIGILGLMYGVSRLG